MPQIHMKLPPLLLHISHNQTIPRGAPYLISCECLFKGNTHTHTHHNWLNLTHTHKICFCHPKTKTMLRRWMIVF